MVPEIKKMKQGMSYTRKEKTIILNVFKYFQMEYSDKCVTEIVRRTSKATGCSEKSIFQFRKEENSVEGFKEPSKTKIRKNLNINSRDIKYDNSVRQAIRNIIYELKYRNIIPSLNTILKQVNADAALPNFSLMTLRRLLFDMGFYYEKNGNKSILVEKGIINKDNLPKLQEAKVVKKPEVTIDPTVNEARKVDAQKIDQVHQNSVVYHGQYNHQNHLLVPMHLPVHNDNHMAHPGHNVMMNRMPAYHQTPWLHSQTQPSLVISSN